MDTALQIILSVVKASPDIYASIKDALVKAGYTVDQVEFIFNKVVPYDQLGINPNAPVQPE